MDWDAVGTFLTDQFGPLAPGSLSAAGHGEWSRAYLFTLTDGRELVVRFSATDADFRKDQRAMAFTSRELPIPRIEKIGRHADVYFAISERARGEFIEERDAAAMRRLLPSLFAALDAARTTSLDGTHGFGLWQPDGNAPFATWRDALLGVSLDVPSLRTHGWRERLRRSPLGQRAFDAGFGRLQRLVDVCPNARYLLHSDLLNFNVLVEGDRISAVIDWGSSMYGDFLWDVAWFTFWQPWYTAWATVDFRAAARAHYAAIGLDVPYLDERMRACELAIGLDGLAYEAFAGKWENLEWTARRVLGLASSAVSGS